MIVGGIPLQQGPGFRLISRNIMQIIVPENAGAVPVNLAQDTDESTSMAGGGGGSGGTTTPPAVATIKVPGLPAVEARGGLADVQVGTNPRATAKLDPSLTSDVNVTVDDGRSSANVRGSKVEIQLGSIHAQAEGTTAPPATPKPNCDRAVIDVHIATPNGISNHLYVEVIPKAKPAPDKSPQNAVTTATTTTTVRGDTTTTSTRFETTPPGAVLPPLTVLPMGTNWPPATVLSPGPVAGAPAGSLLPGLVPSPATPPATPPASKFMLLTPTTPPTSDPSATTAPTTTPTATPSAAPAPAASGTTTPPAAAPPAAPPSTTRATSPGSLDASLEAASLVEGPASGGHALEAGHALPPASFRLPPLPADPLPSAPAAKNAKGKAEPAKTPRSSILRRFGMPDR